MELIEETILLCKKSFFVKDYYPIQINNSNEVLQKYQNIIKKEFIYSITKGLRKTRLSATRKAINDFKKIINQIY